MSSVNPDDCLGSINNAILNRAEDDLLEYRNLIKQRVQFYREENALMKETYEKLKLLKSKIDSNTLDPKMRKDLATLLNIEYDCNNLNTEKTELENAETLSRKRQNYMSKLKICIRHYKNLNDQICNEIKYLRSEKELNTSNLNNIIAHSQDIQQLEEKAKKYENRLSQFEKHPWLKQPYLAFPNMLVQIATLRTMKTVKEDLLKELSVYQNLKPDIIEAREQLAQIKQEMKTIGSI
ncbi:uncharacterized protein LOC126742295 isoform X2 [Anthonomus grandis grandis]|uniref:uncharacterized protein LOC126742295 isoform X2 n=1 Tax=Anthonomus grandis grandis TaxID=2921223 RepID=UPI0021654CF7|nr:uncharacterized protein LOC126742295 isoform X2 [Anthonomus grandis grandis]